MAISGQQRKQMDELRLEIGQKFGRVLASSEGKDLLEYLSRRFFEGDLLGDTPEETAFNLGAREVVRVMRSLSTLVTKQEARNV